MTQLLGLVLISFILTSILLLPFIDLLFHLRRRYKRIDSTAQSTNTPIHNVLQKGKDTETPVGGGILVIFVVIALTSLISYFGKFRVTVDILALIFTILSFGFIGLIDDLKKIFASFNGKYAGLRARWIFLMQIILATIVASILYFIGGFNNVFIPPLGNIVLGLWYLPFAAFVIVAFANAYNISDGLDGLSSGLLTICLFAFLVLAHSAFNENLSIFVGVWIGALIAYLYFNVYPARVYLGDAGAFGFGATLAVVGLLTGKTMGLAVIGGVYIIIVASSLLQIASKKLFHKKIMPVAPIHIYFKYIGWEEPKIVFRFWLAGAIFAILGLWLSLSFK